LYKKYTYFNETLQKCCLYLYLYIDIIILGFLLV